MFDYLTARLKESSTLRGVILATAGIVGVKLTDNDAVTIIAAGQVIAGLVGSLMPDKLGSGGPQ